VANGVRDDSSPRAPTRQRGPARLLGRQRTRTARTIRSARRCSSRNSSSRDREPPSTAPLQWATVAGPGDRVLTANDATLRRARATRRLAADTRRVFWFCRAAASATPCRFSSCRRRALPARVSRATKLPPPQISLRLRAGGRRCHRAKRAEGTARRDLHSADAGATTIALSRDGPAIDTVGRRWAFVLDDRADVLRNFAIGRAGQVANPRGAPSRRYGEARPQERLSLRGNPAPSDLLPESAR
jgi:hypothetical protein